MTVWDFTNWIRGHWFELATLTLLSLNLWFAFEVLSVLRAAIQTMISLANWLDRTRDESTGQSLPAETQGGGRWTPALVGTAPPLLITIALAALSWALLVALLVGIAAAVWAIF